MKIMVLNDGETYTSLAGCKIVEVDDDLSVDRIEEVLRMVDDGAATSQAKELVVFTSNASVIPPYFWDLLSDIVEAAYLDGKAGKEFDKTRVVTADVVQALIAMFNG